MKEFERGFDLQICKSSNPPKIRLGGLDRLKGRNPVKLASYLVSPFGDQHELKRMVLAEQFVIAQNINVLIFIETLKQLFGNVLLQVRDGGV